METIFGFSYIILSVYLNVGANLFKFEVNKLKVSMKFSSWKQSLDKNPEKPMLLL